jgi:hypothetical protein
LEVYYAHFEAVVLDEVMDGVVAKFLAEHAVGSCAVVAHPEVWNSADEEVAHSCDYVVLLQRGDASVWIDCELVRERDFIVDD